MSLTLSLAERNALIVSALNRGEKPKDLGRAYNLSARQIRNIGRFAATPAPASSGSFGEIGLSGLKYSSGYVHEEFLLELNSAPKRYKIYNEMRQNDAVIATGLLSIELTLRRVAWDIEGEENDERVDFVREAWGDMSHSWNDHISEVLSMIPQGFAPFEIVYKRRLGAENPDGASDFNDGKIGWRKFAFRSQDSLREWVFDDRAVPTAMIQATYPDFVSRTIPFEKMVLYRTSREKNNPEGRSLLRPAYTSYYYAKNLRAIEAIGAERDLAGLPVITLPEGADKSPDGSDVTNAKELGQRVRMDEQGSIVKPFGWGFELLSASGSKQFNIAEIIQRYEKRTAMAFLAQFLMLGMDSTGAYALSKDQSDFFVMACGAIADIIAETFSQYAIPRLLKLNGMALENAPKLTHGPLGTPDLLGLADFFAKLGSAQFIKPDVDTEQFLREMIDAPELSEDEIQRREEQRQQMADLRQQQPAPNGNPNNNQDGSNSNPPSQGNEDMPMQENE